MQQKTSLLLYYTRQFSYMVVSKRGYQVQVGKMYRY